jgi:uncharacterized protein
MKLHLTQQAGQNLFTAYGAGYVTVNHQRFETSVIVLPDKLINDWPLAQARIGFEVMDTFAAARTYNILMGEGRRVAAALLL